MVLELSINYSNLRGACSNLSGVYEIPILTSKDCSARPMTTTVAWTPLLNPDLVPLVAIHAHSPLMMDRDVYLSCLSSRIQRMVNASPDPRVAVKEFVETLFQESLVSEVPY